MTRKFALRIATLFLPAVLTIGCGKSDQAAGDPPTPEAFVRQMEAAMASGDGEAIARLVAPPGDAFVRERYRVAREMDAAHAELEKALDKAFGPPPPERTAVLGSPLAEKVIATASTTIDAKRPKATMSIRSQTKRMDGTLLLEIDETFEAGRELVKTVDIAVVQTKDGWRLAQPRDFLPAGADRFETEKRAIGVLRQETKEVAAGLFKNRGEAEDLIAIELVALIAGGLMDSPEWAEVPHLADDAKRLRLIPDLAEGAPPPLSIAIEAAPGTKPGLVRLSIMESQSELPADDLARQLRERVRPGAGGSPTAVHMVIASGLPTEDLLKVLHALVDLRLELAHGVVLQMQDPKELEKAAPQITGRLRFLTLDQSRQVAGKSPPTEPKLDLEKADPKITLENSEPKLDLEKPAPNVDARVPPLTTQTEPSDGVAVPSARQLTPLAVPPAAKLETVPRGTATGTGTAGRVSTDPTTKKP